MQNYLADSNKKEIHDMTKTVPACEINEIKEEHRIWLDTENEVKDMIRVYGYNGCAHCLRKYNIR